MYQKLLLLTFLKLSKELFINSIINKLNDPTNFALFVYVGNVSV